MLVRPPLWPSDGAIMLRKLLLVVFVATFCSAAWPASSAEPARSPPEKSRAGNRLTYLDENNPWYPRRNFPKLVTPQWVGEESVECVVVLAIDDMREPAKYESFLRPILERLKKIDGRAPVSIMTCNVKPDDPQLAQWLAEGLSLEVHTIDHPCPLLQGGDFAKAKSTYDRCVDLLNEIPGNKPVAFRMPCCDSLNTVSPRFYSEIFNQTTTKGNFLSISSSVFNLFTPNDPDIPRELVIDSDGREKFRKYLPQGLVREGKTFDTFVNYVEDYPYPYVVNRLCWEFPCVVPSDWSAQHLQKPDNPDTVRDLKAALDITVLKQGVYNLVFHPHNWIKPEQIVELIDHAVETHGKKVKFLTFREALERLNQNLLRGMSLRNSGDASRTGIYLADINDDGFIDVLAGGASYSGDIKTKGSACWLWSPESRSWNRFLFPTALAEAGPHGGARDVGARFGYVGAGQENTYLVSPRRLRNSREAAAGFWTFRKDGWVQQEQFLNGLIDQNDPQKKWLLLPFLCQGATLRDLDRDGLSEVIVGTPDQSAIYQWNEQHRVWALLPFTLPGRTSIANVDRRFVDVQLLVDAGLRFIDIDEDGHDDIVFSNAERYGVYLFNDMQTGWGRVVLEGKRSAPEASGRRKPAGEDKQNKPAAGEKRDSVPKEQRSATSPLANGGRIGLPPIVRADGTDNGFFVHSRYLFWQNEDTARLPDLVDRRSFNEILAQAPDLPPKPKSPEASLNSIRVRPGFKVELMAAEPLVLDPIAFAFGADGKLWVVEMGDYPLGPSGGQIRFLEDTDGDGRYDKATVFLEVPYPTGVLPWRKGILVTAAPNIFYAEDTDGDGKADKREILYTGFAEGNQQHRVNSLVWGLDNWIYVANGDSGGEIVSRKTGKKVNASGRDLRIRPDTGELDAVTGQTQFGRSRDDWGNWFGCNNSNPMYQYVLDDVYQRRNPHYSGAVPRVDVPEVAGNAPVFPISQLQVRFNDFHTANRFTSACSAMIYRDDLFGPHFAGNAFICEPVHNLVHREIVSSQGVVFKSKRAPDEQESEFLASTDNWFRPTTVKTGPDGALWIADMYRHVIEHPQWIPDTWQKKLDLRAGHDQGRIYRIYPVDRKPRAIPRLDKLNTAGLVAALDSPGGWQRDVVQQLLIERQDKAAIPLLEKQTVNSSNPLCRLHALATLAGFGPVSRSVLLRALDDAEPGVRRHAVCLTETQSEELPEDLLTALLRRTNDDDAQVRLQLAYTLGEIKNPLAAETLGQMLVFAGDDRFLLAALMSSVNRTNIDAVLASVLSAAHHDAPNQNVIGLLLDLSAALGNDQGLAKLVQFVTRAQSDKFADWQFLAFGRLLDSLTRRNETLTGKIKKTKGADPENLITGIDKFFAAARTQVADDQAPIEARAAALRLLGRGRDQHETDLELLASLLPPQAPAELQEAAILALGRLPHDRVPELLLTHWRGFGPARRSQVLDILMSRDAWAADLMAAVAEDKVVRTDFNAARRQRLLEHRSIDVRQKSAAAFAITVNADRQTVINQYQPALAAKGDLARGARLFAKDCAQCHKLAGVGFEVGPDLASLTDKSPEAMLVAVLDPNRAVESKFLAYVAETKAGMIVTGLLASETGNSITLRSPEGKEQVILRADLEELVSTSKSTMPEGFEKDLAPQDLADIIAHVRSNVPLPKRKEFAGNEPQPVKPAADGTLRLGATDCEIYGSTLIFEPQFKNLGYWSSLDDHALWTIEGARPGKYTVEFDWACDGSVAGNPWLLETGGAHITGKTESTGNWDAYRKKIVGEITLATGRQRLILRPAEKPQGALMDLNAIRLVPVK